MCDFGVTAMVGLGLSALGTAAGAFAAYNQAKAANQAADYNAQVLRNNAAAAQAQAADAVARGGIEEKKYRLQVANMKGAQRAAMGGSGLLVDSGTNQDVTADTAAYGELDSLAIRSNAAREAWGYNIQANDYPAQANLAASRKTNPMGAAMGSLLSGASGIAGQLYGAGAFKKKQYPYGVNAQGFPYAGRV